MEISPQGIVIASFSPFPKSIFRVLYAKGTFCSFPSLRTFPPFPKPSTEVFAVPALKPERESNPNVKCVASGIKSFNCDARQSVGITSKPTPGHTTIPLFFASLSSDFACSKTETSPVISR